MKNRSASLCMLAMSLVLCACATADQDAMGDKVIFARDQLYPEGVAFRRDTKEFLVTSLRRGEIGAVSARGAYRVLATDPDLLSVTGIKYDAKSRRILACNTHPGATAAATSKTPGSVAQLFVFSRDGAREAVHDLAALRPGVPHFCNDIAVDTRGNIYVTDSFAPVIYRITPEGDRSIFVEHSAFASPDPGKAFALNGIVFHPDGYLLANHMSNGKLLKIRLDTKAVEEVGLEQPIPGADGMVLVNSNTVAVVQNGLTGGPKQAVRLVSQDGWRNASVTGRADVGDVTPTTATLAGSQVYVIDARLSEMFDGGGPRSKVFTLHKADFR